MATGRKASSLRTGPTVRHRAPGPPFPHWEGGLGGMICPLLARPSRKIDCAYKGNARSQGRGHGPADLLSGLLLPNARVILVAIFPIAFPDLVPRIRGKLGVHLATEGCEDHKGGSCGAKDSSFSPSDRSLREGFDPECPRARKQHNRQEKYHQSRHW